MGALESNTTLIYGIHLRESANDGSDFGNGASDYRVLFLGEDGQLHVKDSAGTVTDIGAGSATPPDCKEAFMSADTSSSGGANALFDLTGASLSLGAGTWLVRGQALASETNTGSTTIGLAIHDGTSAVAMSATSRTSGVNGDRCHVTVSKRITLGSTATVKLQGISTRTTTTFLESIAGTFGTGPADTATCISAIKVTAV